jgi:hypothetical protein
MSGTSCGTCGKQERYIEGFVGRPLGKPERRERIILKMVFKNVMRRNELDQAQSRDSWRAVVNAEMNIRLE